MPRLHANLGKATPVYGQIDNKTPIPVLAIRLRDLHIRIAGERDNEFLGVISDLAFGLATCTASRTDTAGFRRVHICKTEWLAINPTGITI